VNVTGFNHVSVNTNGAPLGEVVDFYARVLGLGDQLRPDIPGVPGHWHAVGGQQLHIVGAPSRGHGIDPTGPHFCVTVDDLTGAVAELEASGIEYVRGVQGEGTVQIWIVDPAGNTVELQQDRSG
jgi:catechol 2,3-dioxygenase-like lactoylglutathione lyase family enzyme